MGPISCSETSAGDYQSALRQIAAFGRKVLALSSTVQGTILNSLSCRATRSFETSETSYRATKHHILEDANP
jgi:hypothetical protein